MRSVQQVTRDEQLDRLRRKSRRALCEWRDGDRPSIDGIASAGHLADRLESGCLYLPGVPALDAWKFKSRACKPIAQAVLATTVMWPGNKGGEAMPATYVELARLAHVSKRTAQNAVAELLAAGWIERYAHFRPGGVGRDGKQHKVFQTTNRYVAGPTLRFAWMGRPKLKEQAGDMRVATVATPPEYKKKLAARRSRPAADKRWMARKKVSNGAPYHDPAPVLRMEGVEPAGLGRLSQCLADAMALIEAQKAAQAA
jgi:hypothetical protein